MTRAKEYHVSQFHRSVGTEFQIRLPQQVLMRRPDRLAGVASALREDHLGVRMIRQNAQKLTRRVAGGPHDSDFDMLF